MMNFVLDTHTHTIVSGHAYSTREAMIEAAKAAGLELLAITEHAPKMYGSCGMLQFYNTRILSRREGTLEVLYGAEVNVIDYAGRIDLKKRQMQSLDLVIASLHTVCLRPGTEEDNTRACIGALRNPIVDILGHPDDDRYPLNLREVAYGAAQYEKMLEINNSSLNPNTSRTGAREQYLKLLEYCKEYGVYLSCGTDAHEAGLVGRFDSVIDLLEEADYPQELIVNTSAAKLKAHLRKFS